MMACDQSYSRYILDVNQLPKMNRRSFIQSATLTAASAGMLANPQLLGDHHQNGHAPKLLEWRQWKVDSAAKRSLIDRQLQQAALPALNRAGIQPIGVFYPQDQEDHSIYALVPFPSFESYYNMRRLLEEDEAFMQASQEYLGTPKNDPAYSRIESTLMRPFDGYPDVKIPRKGERIFELRVYESHNEAKAALKVEMFNSGEFDIFEKVGLDSVFCGEALSGPNLPNLTYLVAYKDMEERKAAWGRFSSHPDWDKLKVVERYKDTVSKIHQTFLNPAPYSQI